MTDAELDLYFDYFRRFNDQISQPDKVILLHTPDVNVLLRRIAERGREEERGIDADFLRGLNAYYEIFDQVARNKYGMDVLKIDVSNRDFRAGEQLQAFLEEIEAFLKVDRPSELPLRF